MAFQGVLTALKASQRNKTHCEKSTRMKTMNSSIPGWAILFSALALSACTGTSRPSAGTTPAAPPSVTGTAPEDTPLATPDLPLAPFELGTVVAQNEAYYREFWGMTTQGFFVVQDFYHAGGVKRTDPYTMLRLDEVHNWILSPQQSLTQQYEALWQVGIDGPYVQWHANGQKAIEGLYQNRLPQGQWKLWYDNGVPMFQEELINGVRNGPSMGWYPNGKQAGQGQYVNGVRDGVWILWYNNGSKMQEGAYGNEQQQGDWTYWYDNGARKQAGRYLDGVQVGVWSWWDRQGNLVRELNYGETGELKPQIGSGTIQPRAW